MWEKTRHNCSNRSGETCSATRLRGVGYHIWPEPGDAHRTWTSSRQSMKHGDLNYGPIAKQTAFPGRTTAIAWWCSNRCSANFILPSHPQDITTVPAPWIMVCSWDKLQVRSSKAGYKKAIRKGDVCNDERRSVTIWTCISTMDGWSASCTTASRWHLLASHSDQNSTREATCCFLVNHRVAAGIPALLLVSDHWILILQDPSLAFSLPTGLQRSVSPRSDACHCACRKCLNLLCSPWFLVLVHRFWPRECIFILVEFSFQ